MSQLEINITDLQALLTAAQASPEYVNTTDATAATTMSSVVDNTEMLVDDETGLRLI